jgi:aminoglycoside phosphotransferase (APT) family kinase protein
MKPDLSFSEDLILNTINNLAVNQKFTAIIELVSGWNNYSYLADGAVVIRIPKSLDAANSLENERTILPTLAGLLPAVVPEILFNGYLRSTEGLNVPFYAYRYIQGIELGDPRLKGLSKSQLVLPIANFLRTLHSLSPSETIPLAKFQPIDLLCLDLRFDNARKRLMTLKERNFVINVDEYLEHMISATAFKSEAPQLVHGDLHFRQVIINDNRQVGILDWSNCQFSQVGVDLQIAYSLFNREDRKLFFELYGEVSPQQKKLAKTIAISVNAGLAGAALESSEGSILNFAVESLTRAIA